MASAHIVAIAKETTVKSKDGSESIPILIAPELANSIKGELFFKVYTLLIIFSAPNRHAFFIDFVPLDHVLTINLSIDQAVLLCAEKRRQDICAASFFDAATKLLEEALTADTVTRIGASQIAAFFFFLE